MSRVSYTYVTRSGAHKTKKLSRHSHLNKKKNNCLVCLFVFVVQLGVFFAAIVEEATEHKPFDCMRGVVFNDVTKYLAH